MLNIECKCKCVLSDQIVKIVIIWIMYQNTAYNVVFKLTLKNRSMVRCHFDFLTEYWSSLDH